jgi:acyl-CoA thioesterase-1
MGTERGMGRNTFGRTRTVGPYGARTGLRNLALTLAFVAAGSAAAAQPVTIAALGDSLTAGYGLPEEEGFVPQLQAWLRANGAPEVTVVNAGVSGDTSAGGLARADWTLTDNVEGLILALGANDLLRGVDPAVTRANLDGILAKAEARDLPVLLAGIPAPGNYGPEYQAQFDAIFPELAEKHGATVFPNFLAGLGDRPDLVTVGPLMQPDGLHPNAMGVAAVVAAIGPAVLDLVSAAQQD